MIDRPKELDADTLWTLLAWYANRVGYCEGILFTDNKHVVLAADQWVDTYGVDACEDEDLPIKETTANE